MQDSGLNSCGILIKPDFRIALMILASVSHYAKSIVLWRRLMTKFSMGPVLQAFFSTLKGGPLVFKNNVLKCRALMPARQHHTAC